MFKILISKINTKCCLCVFLMSLFVSYFLVNSNLWSSWYIILGLMFMISFATTMACLVRNIKERTTQAVNYKKSIFGIISAIIGVGALQVCGVNALFCGSSIGLGIMSLIFPTAILHDLSQYSVYIVIASIIAQWFGVWMLKCFSKRG